MTDIPVYDSNGQLVYHLTINDDIQYLDGRVSKGTGLYYKGLGVPYKNHMLTTVTDTNVYNILGKSDVFYLGNYVRKKCFEDKFGIFQEKFQPQFSDFIGACGVKELSIMEHSQDFARSSVEFVKATKFDTENNQYYFSLQYHCGRRKFLQYPDKPYLLHDLLDYMIDNDWNFIWDKNSITDVTYDGRVSDVADLFKSNELSAKVGTVYSLIYSLGKSNYKAYLEFIKYLGLNHYNNMSYVHNTVSILDEFGVNVSVLLMNNDINEDYKNTVINYLLTGRNCGHCSYIGLGDEIKQQYIESARKSLGINT